MIWSGWDGDLGLELYLADSQYPDDNQHAQSQCVMQFINQHGFSGRIEVHQLRELNGHADFFRIINDPRYEIKLPFLVVGYGCETGAILGYAGLENVTAQLTDLLLKDRPNRINQQY